MSEESRNRPAVRPEAAGPTADDELAERIGAATRDLELADPDAGLAAVDRAVNRFVEALGVGLLGSLLAIIFANAFSRYAFNHSFVWAEEVVISLVPWLAMVGLFLSVRRRQMIRIDVFVQKFRPSQRRVLVAMTHLLCAAVFGYLAWLGLDYVFAFGGDRTPYLGLPKGLFTSALWIGGAAAAVAFVAQIRERR